MTTKIGLRHRFCRDTECRQCLADHESFGKELEKKTFDSYPDHLGLFRKWIESQVSYEVETEWGWSHPDIITEEFADAYAKDFLDKKI